MAVMESSPNPAAGPESASPQAGFVTPIHHVGELSRTVGAQREVGSGRNLPLQTQACLRRSWPHDSVAEKGDWQNNQVSCLDESERGSSFQARLLFIVCLKMSQVGMAAVRGSWWRSQHDCLSLSQFLWHAGRPSSMTIPVCSIRLLQLSAAHSQYPR